MPGIFLNPSQCCCSPTFAAFHVRGCNAIALPDAVIEVWDTPTKATKCGSGVTDSSGNASIALSPVRLPPLFYYCEVTHPSSRFVFYSGNCSLGSPNGIGLVPAPGYYCFASCVIPISGTLHYSDPIAGAVTLAYGVVSGVGAWRGVSSYNYPGCVTPFGTCDPATLALNVSLSAFGNGGWSYAAGAPHLGSTLCCPGSPLFFPGCSLGSYGDSIGGINGSATATCSPFSWSGALKPFAAASCMNLGVLSATITE